MITNFLSVRTVETVVHLLTVSVVGASILFGQVSSTLPDLNSWELQSHAKLPPYNQPGEKLDDALARGRIGASVQGTAWRGMDFVISDEAPAGFTLPMLLKYYQNLVCQSDSIIVGQVKDLSTHISANGTSVYTDYVLSVGSVLKDIRAQALRPLSQIVFTRQGGAITLANGPVRFIFQEYPDLEPGKEYVLFLRALSGSGAYQALDSFSTLVVTGNAWVVARKSLAGVSLPEFSLGAMDRTISSWARSCKQ